MSNSLFSEVQFIRKGVLTGLGIYLGFVMSILGFGAFWFEMELLLRVLKDFLMIYLILAANLYLLVQLIGGLLSLAHPDGKDGSLQSDYRLSPIRVGITGVLKVATLVLLGFYLWENVSSMHLAGLLLGLNTMLAVPLIIGYQWSFRTR